MQNRAFMRSAGTAMLVGAVLAFAVNSCISPFLSKDLPIAQMMLSSVFLWRQALAAIAAALLLLGCVGVYLRQQEKAGRFGEWSFIVAFFGTVLVLAVEWNDVFLVRDIARTVPDTLAALEAAHHPSLYDIGSTVPLIVFFVGWILLSAASLRSRVISRVGPILVIVGLVLIPALAKLSAGVWGPILGGACMSVGWFWMGYETRKVSEPTSAAM
jgi:hypothetical protein